MNSNSNNQELQQRLAKGITVFKLRDTLTKFGILENERVTVSFKRNNQILASSEIEPIDRKDRLQAVASSSEDFNTEIIDGFLMPTEELIGLSQVIPDLDETAEETSEFSLEFSNRNSIATMKTCFYRSCVNCPNNRRCCWKRC